MVLGVNIVPAAAADANDATATASPVTTGAAVDFSADGVILSSGNAATVDGTKFTLGAAITGAAAGVEIVNPFMKDASLTADSFVDAVVRTGGDNNFFIYRKPDTMTAFAIDPDKDVYFVAPFESVEAAQKCTIYKDADGYYTAGKYSDKFEVKTISEALSDGWITEAGAKKITDTNADIKDESEKYTHVCRWVTGTEEQAMTNWDVGNYTPVIMNLAQANGTGTSSTAVNVVNPTWKDGVTISMNVKASSEIPTPVFVFSNRDTAYAGNNLYGGLVFYTDGTFVFTEDDASGLNGAKQNVYGATYLNSDTPINNVGKWIQVTLTIKNDKVEVYYNGQKCEPKMNHTNADSGPKYFNYSYGYDADDRTKVCLTERSRHAQRLVYITKNGIKNFSKETCLANGMTLKEYFAAEKDGDFGYSKYYDSNGVNTHSIMEYITGTNCKLFIGGDDGKGFNNLVGYCELAKGKYSLSSRYQSYMYITKRNNNSTTENWKKISENEDVAKDMQIKDLVFNDSLATALERTGLTLEAWTYKNGDAYRIADKASKAEAIAQYDSMYAQNHAQYERAQVWQYAKTTQAAKAIVANGDGTTENVVTAEAADATCTVAEVILANAQAANNSKASALANINNFWKQYNVNTYTNEQVIGWAMGNIESVDLGNSHT